MKASWRTSADLYCGLLLLAIATFGVWINSDLDFGVARDMGPGYFPIVISCILGAVSLLMIVRGLAAPSDEIGSFDLRPVIFLLLSFLAFAYLINSQGLVIAIIAQIAIAHFASRDAKAWETALVGIGMVAFSSTVFVLLLKLPLKLLP